MSAAPAPLRSLPVADQLPKLDLRKREDRMRAVGLAVMCGESKLHWRARFVVSTLAYIAHEREEPDRERLTRYTSMSWRTVRKHLAVVEAACGEDPVRFIRELVDGRRPMAEWTRALELHGGRRGA